MVFDFSKSISMKKITQSKKIKIQITLVLQLRISGEQITKKGL